MARKKREDPPAPGAPLWMVSYGDLMTNMVCLFVLLYSFSILDAQKFQAAMVSIQSSLGVLDSGRGINPSAIYDADTEMEDFNMLEEKLTSYLEDSDLHMDVMVQMETRGLVLRFQDNVLFDPGSADLKPSSIAILNYLGEFLIEPEFESKHVRIEGHTDTTPVGRNSRYETNWELSVARSASGVRYLIEELNLDPQRFSAAGYGEYQPVAPNDTPENKAKNRRIDIVILKSELEFKTP